MGREGRDYRGEQLSEYWDSGLTIQEYREQKAQANIVIHCICRCHNFF